MISNNVLKLFPREIQLAIRARANEFLSETEWDELHKANTISQWHEIMKQRAVRAAQRREEIGLYRSRLMTNGTAARGLKQRRIRG